MESWDWPCFLADEITWAASYLPNMLLGIALQDRNRNGIHDIHSLAVQMLLRVPSGLDRSHLEAEVEIQILDRGMDEREVHPVYRQTDRHMHYSTMGQH